MDPQCTLSRGRCGHGANIISDKHRSVKGGGHQTGTGAVGRVEGQKPVGGIRRWGTEAKGAIGTIAWSYGVGT